MNVEEMEQRHNSMKMLVDMLSEFSKDGANPFKLMKIEMEITDKLHNFTKDITELTDKEILQKEEKLLKILKVVNKEVE